ncbi:c-type cytochrome [Cupriavidus basilensis]|uniref:C-type cytochrome n=1 Tax=Cupriavidus basilensis TaxID=68895 RepID=A0ABT6AGR4_9BURK|nr:c-type cytochrome [Cupriavidus basilensis]MDF3831790.1 c-type cytochrome [Cupriavidus basilensis]
MLKRNLCLMLACTAVLLACGQKKDAASAQAEAAAPTPAQSVGLTAASPPATPENTLGKSTFGKVCSMCHVPGVAGAPKVGDKADWGPRMAQGNETLYKHALEGFSGNTGMMPARGGSTSLADDAVKAAVDYMTAQAR